MTTIVKDVAAKFAVAIVAVAMIFTMFAPAANAQEQSVEDLQALIESLMAQINALESDMGGSTGGSSSSAVCPYTWTRDLSQGSTGADVMKLQQFLNETPDLRVAATGAGSPGMETEYYGPATAAAVSKMQVMFRAEVLTPAGLVNPTGYFGPSSRTKANSLCVAAAVVDDMDDEDEMEDEDGMEDEDEDDSSNMSLSGEASLDSFELDDGESEIEEGDEDEVVGEITVEFTDGDAEISRIDVTLQGTGNAEPWEAFETVSLWVDGDMVAEFDATDEDDYLDEDTGEIRFTNLDIIAEEDEELEILVGVSVQNNIDGDEQVDWDLEVSSMRFFDADGVATTEEDPAGSDVAEFEITEAGADEELNISLASSNPDATDIIVDTDNDTNGVTIMVADLEAQDNDIELNRVVVLVETPGATTTSVVDDVSIVIDGQTFDAEAIGGTPGDATTITSSRSVLANADEESVWYVFDVDGDVVLDEDDEVEMEVVVDFNDTNDGANYTNGQQISASITSGELNEWEAEGADDLENSQFDGTANGDDHTLVAEGILVPVDGFTADETTLGDNDNIGEFTLEFEVSAVEGNFYITDLATTTDQDNGVRFSVTNGGDAAITGTLTSTADEDGGVFEVREGETETFTLTVTLSAASTLVTPRVTLTEVNYTDETDGLVNGGVGVIEGTYLPTPASDFRTGVQTIQATP